MTYINLVVEDALHESSLRKIITVVNPGLEVHEVYSRGGYDYIFQNLKAFNAAAVYTPYLVLTDLDQRPCAKAMRDEWLSKFTPHHNLIFRIAVRQVEAWLLADRHNLAAFLSISPDKITREPESIPNPKKHLIDLAKGSRQRTIREDLVPIKNARVGQNYNGRLTEFISKAWNVNDAEKNSDSLKRLSKRLREFKPKQI
jgi:hypothetical protein